MTYDLKAGLYQHYKGGFYQTIGIGRHSETDEPFVVYVALALREGSRLCVRPAALFFDEVCRSLGHQHDRVSFRPNPKTCQIVPRFRYIGTELPAEAVQEQGQ